MSAEWEETWGAIRPLITSPQPWGAFFERFSSPEHWVERVQSNLSLYSGNYALIYGILVAFSVLSKPASVIGLVIIALLVAMLANRIVHRRDEDGSRGASRSTLQVSIPYIGTVHAVALVAGAYFSLVIAGTRFFAPVVQALATGTLICLAHASLRSRNLRNRVLEARGAASAVLGRLSQVAADTGLFKVEPPTAEDDSSGGSRAAAAAAAEARAARAKRAQKAQ
eukprot:tig00021179_g19221.t1